MSDIDIELAGAAPVEVMRLMWRHAADPMTWPLYRHDAHPAVSWAQPAGLSTPRLPGDGVGVA